MTPSEERRALTEKIEEIRKASAEMDARYARLPFNEETRELREMMGKMLGELHRMEENMQRLLRLGEDSEAEGGTENGN